MWDDQFTQDAFIALMGREKVGKSQWIMEIAMRGLMENCNVAFFQAGDMTARQQRRRMFIYLAQKSDKEKYCGDMLVPVIDCRHNQADTCTKHTSGGVDTEQDIDNLSYEHLRDDFYNNPNYQPCRNEGCIHRRPAVWFQEQKRVEPLTVDEARRIVYKFRQKYKNRFKLATYANETLTMAEINSRLDLWERQENFVPNVILLDYIDICASDTDCLRLDIRHQEHKKWQRARKISAERHCLFVTVTQTDAEGYDSNKLLSMKNFSESKTKHAEVTAEYGLNQTDNEKRIGIMRINQIAIREGECDTNKVVHVLQRLQKGRPYLGSF